MARVFLVEDERGRQYALKTLDPEWAGSEIAQARFVAEAQALEEVRHPNVVRAIPKKTVSRRQPGLLLEHIKGRTLRQCLPELVETSLSRRLHLARQLAEAIMATHEAGWRHGDIKPDNILVDGRNHLTLIDFGAARPVDAQGRGHAMMTTPAYMAPEEAQGSADLRADIYGLGVVLYELFVGRKPFPRVGYKKLLALKQQGAMRPLVRSGSKLLSRVHDLLMACLRPRPSERPQSIQAVWLALRDLEKAAAAGGRKRPASTLRRSLRRMTTMPPRPWLTAASVLLCAGSMALAKANTEVAREWLLGAVR